MENNLLYPINIIRKSKRAKRVILKMKPLVGLEIILPSFVDEKEVPAILQYFKPWIEKHKLKFESELCKDKKKLQFPEAFFIRGGKELILPFVNGTKNCLQLKKFKDYPEKTAIREYAKKMLPPHVGELITTQPRYISVPGKFLPIKKCLVFSMIWLREWVREEARLYFSHQINNLAEKWNFDFTSISMRFQKTRWGSCSSHKTINLNACLLFLPEYLSRYILIHELCHTREMNHSAMFWKQVFAIEPKAVTYDKAMRNAWKYVPEWIFFDKSM